MDSARDDHPLCESIAFHNEPEHNFAFDLKSRKSRRPKPKIATDTF